MTRDWSKTAPLSTHNSRPSVASATAVVSCDDPERAYNGRFNCGSPPGESDDRRSRVVVPVEAERQSGGGVSATVLHDDSCEVEEFVCVAVARTNTKGVVVLISSSAWPVASVVTLIEPSHVLPCPHAWSPPVIEA